jgi:hypothetical protein
MYPLRSYAEHHYRSNIIYNYIPKTSTCPRFNLGLLALMGENKHLQDFTVEISRKIAAICEK